MQKADFPIFQNHPELVYLDSAATTQKPAMVADSVHNYLRSRYANPGRGVYPLSVNATGEITKARGTIARFFGAQGSQLVLTANATEALNLVARGIEDRIQPGDEIIVSELDHHSNLLPWISLAKRRGALLKWLPFNPQTGKVTAGDFSPLLTAQTKVVALSLVSNVFGTRLPWSELSPLLHRQGREDLVVVLDACQAAPVAPLSFSDYDVDFMVVSGHKMYGPSGVGLLLGKPEALDTLTPARPGGGSVEMVQKDQITWKSLPDSLEGGTPNSEGIIGMATAVEYLQNLGMDQVAHHHNQLIQHAREQLTQLGVTWLVSHPDELPALLSFTIPGVHSHDVAQYLGDRGVCIRAGHHCASPLHQRLNLPGSCRVSFGVYNDHDDVDALVQALTDLQHDYHVNA